ncbi:MAG: hypothetical protein LBE09_03475 [Christensenellaceae bacterium]|jgi:hypothetical protein|nr:hypothetical protein [Christensenellaceae bacterium]
MKGETIRREALKKLWIPVAFTLILSVALVTSIAWFYTSSKLGVSPTVLEASKAFTAQLSSSLVESDGYNGQTGNGALGTDDAPYEVEISLNINASTSGHDCKLKINIEHFAASFDDVGVTASYLAESYVPLNFFTFRLVAEDVEYKLDVDGDLANASTGAKYIVHNGNNVFMMKIIYLSEARYLKWKQGVYDYDPFEFNAIKYSGAKFYFKLNYSVQPG